MRNRPFSLTRRLVITTLTVGILSSVGLVSAMVLHQREIQVDAFDAGLRGTADSLLGAVVDAEDQSDGITLDMRGVMISPTAVYKVLDGSEVLEETRDVPGSFNELSETKETSSVVRAEMYRFVVRRGTRIVDPQSSYGGTHHSITVIYGLPEAMIWTRTVRSVRFFAVASLITLALGTIILLTVLRQSLKPLAELTSSAAAITPRQWSFHVSESAKRIKELDPLVIALQRSLERLAESFNQQRRFTHDAAHELKTDVAIVKSSLQYLAMSEHGLDEYRDGIFEALDDFGRLEADVLRMLTLARLESDEDLREEYAPVSASDLISESLRDTEPLAKLRNVEIAVNVPSEAQLLVDSRDGKLLFSNLLVNAVQHTARGTTVSLDGSISRGRLYLTVKDYGDGFIVEDIPHLLRPFYRSDPSRSRKSGGTGLGLSICHAICRKLGGTISLSNDPQGGACVHLELPCTGSLVAVEWSR